LDAAVGFPREAVVVRPVVVDLGMVDFVADAVLGLTAVTFLAAPVTPVVLPVVAAGAFLNAPGLGCVGVFAGAAETAFFAGAPAPVTFFAPTGVGPVVKAFFWGAPAIFF